MNLDKKLSKYAKHINNPKYYDHILQTIDKVKKNQHVIKKFSNADINYIIDMIYGFFEVNNTPEKRQRVLKYFNTIWFIVSDKHYILIETPFLLLALFYYIRFYLLLFFSKTTRLINPAHYYICKNAEWNLYIFRGALKAAKFIGCDVWDLEENNINNL